MSEYDHEIKALELRLKQWDPAQSSVTSSEMLFEAGRRAGKKESRSKWTPVVVGAVTLTLGFGLASVQQATQRQSTGQVESDRVARRQVVEPGLAGHNEPLSYLSMTRSFATSGEVSTLPETRVSTATHADSFTPRSRLDKELID